MEGDDPDRTWIMPKRTAAVLTAVLLLTLTGCAGTPDDVSSEPPAANASSSTVETPEPTPTVEPGIIQHTPEPTPEPDTSTGEAAYIAAAQDYLNGRGYWDFTDDQLLSAGLYACESSEETVTIIEGIAAPSNDEIVSYARTLLCP